MIDHLTVAIPNNMLKREYSEALAKFEKVTGITNTLRYPGSILEYINDALRVYSGPRDVQNVILVTQTPERLSPCMAMDVVKTLKLPSSTLAFDVNHACDGWVIGVHLANKLSGKTLLVCADMLRYAPNDIEKYIFSDCVSITCVSPGQNEFKAFVDPSGIDKLYLTRENKMLMDGSAVFDFVTEKMPAFIKSFGSASWLVLHQANMTMLNLLAKRSGYSDRSLISISKYGNMSMNSIPATLALYQGSILGREVLCVGFGAGFTAAGINLYFPHQSKLEIKYV
jgi:3-oxoacyl-[acyl-carrier-protein] synthase-3